MCCMQLLKTVGKRLPLLSSNSSAPRLLYILLLLLTGVAAHAQNLSNRGKEFWVGYGHHQFMEPGWQNDQQMILYLSAEQPATVTVSLQGTTWVRTYNIPANTVIATDFIPSAGAFDARLYSLPPSFGGTGGEGVFTNKGIHIVSNVPIVAYAHIYGSLSSGATMLMPVETWGYYYVSLNSEQNYANDCFSWMYVVAKDDNTVIEVTPSKPSRNGRVAGVPFTATLMKGQIYQLIGASLGGGKGNELTGTKVRSIANPAGQCYPIAVFSGSSRTAISCTPGGGGGGDNNMQQVFPSQAWGKRYLTAPLSADNSASSFMTSIYKVLVKDPATVVKLNGTTLTGLIDNSYYQFISSTADYVEADKPVLVAQFMSSSGSCPNTSGLGDPEMIYLSPIEQAIKRVGFYRNDREEIDVNYLTLIIPDSGMISLTIDGSNTFSHTYNHTNLPGYTVVVKRWAAAQAQCIVKSDSAFTAITYGEGSVESYGYNAGTLINNLSAVGAIHNVLDTSAVSNDFTCTNTPVELSVLMAYQPTKMVWKLSQLGTAITPNADVTVNAPVPAGTVLVDGIPYYKYTLPNPYQFTAIDTFQIPIQSTHPSIENCYNSEEVKFDVIVKGKPKADFSVTHTGCTMDTVYFKGSDDGNGYTVERWKWTYPGPAEDSGQNVQRKFPAGPLAVKLTAITEEGCLSDTTKNITVHEPPVADFSTSTASLCEGGGVTITDNSTYEGSAPLKSWYWDFGNDTTATVTTDDPQKANYAAYRPYAIKHVVKVSDLCISDTVTKNVTVYAKPSPKFSYPANCLPVDGVVQFTSTASTVDGQTISGHAWDFGDPGATPANPNTSELASPTHIYSTFGTYTIKYKATTANGCTKDTTLSATFNLMPKLEYAALQPVCESEKGSVQVSLAKATNGVTGKGIYKGPGTDTLGNFRPSVAKAGTHTIWYVFTTSGGCKDSVSGTIVVNPKPAAAFSADANICQNEAVNIADQSVISDGSITSWSWTFGDGTNATYTSNDPFTKTYTSNKAYDIKLVAKSDMGCVSDTIAHQVVVRPLPVASFSLPKAVCMPEGQAAFTNLSAVSDQSALSYQWSFGDGTAGATTKDPTHVYMQKGPFTVNLVATSAYGCKDDSAVVLDAFYDKPIASFSVEPDTLCQGTDNVFTDLSTAPNSTIKAWTWSFGDGSGATARNPVKRYTSPGNYDVQLTVTNEVGCVSMPYDDKVIVYLQPVIEVGPSFIVPMGTGLQFQATANDSSVLTFRWDPPGDLMATDILKPALIAMHDETYTLTATGQGNCSATDAVSVKVLKPVKVPNAFSPNGDHINDRWVIPNLGDYPGATVEVFNRYGQRVYRSSGYGTPWDGWCDGKLLPLATYYYVIKLRNGFQPLTGYVMLIR